eukprot:CAMPEP_0206373262 /NCGR_PEP_ID=MMETSP0294-20121207/7601_1 /ASSEMBLY_ACC=CAM_ASM_000327 /TAXON_ID=39354 /ORGANISM="Heterosigma akashiwo, Strain CCMP2393" /LENGTH=354 /DNA_ID=CAMNT_0053820801 /DNA_START=106 /DNA_END=1166 /DNA_ORIENTATION=+
MESGSESESSGKELAPTLHRRLMTCTCQHSVTYCNVHETDFVGSIDLSFAKLKAADLVLIKSSKDNRGTTVIDKFVSLKSLNLSHNALGSTAFLGFVPWSKSLTILNLNHNHIESLRGLESLSSLQVLRCMGNKLEELGPIPLLTELQELWLSKNKIGILELYRLQPLDKLTRLLLKPNPCYENENCRFFTIQMLPAISNIDGNEVSVDERTASFSFIQGTGGKVLVHQARARLGSSNTPTTFQKGADGSRTDLKAAKSTPLKSSNASLEKLPSRRPNHSRSATLGHGSGASGARSLIREGDASSSGEGLPPQDLSSQSEGGSPRHRRRRRPSGPPGGSGVGGATMAAAAAAVA